MNPQTIDGDLIGWCDDRGIPYTTTTREERFPSILHEYTFITPETDDQPFELKMRWV